MSGCATAAMSVTWRRPGSRLTSLLAVTLTLAISLLATTQAAPPLRTHQFTNTGYQRPEGEILAAYNLDEDVEQLMALKNRGARDRLHHQASLQQEDNDYHLIQGQFARVGIPDNDMNPRLPPGQFARVGIPDNDMNPQLAPGQFARVGIPDNDMNPRLAPGRASEHHRLLQKKSTDNVQRRFSYYLNSQNNDGYLHKSSTGVPRYTKEDLAEYIYNTGDEDGVYLAIQELTQEGLMSSEEARNYMYEIRNNLQNLMDQDSFNGQKGVMKDLANKSKMSMESSDIHENNNRFNSASNNENEMMLEKLRNEKAPTDMIRDYYDNDYSMEEVIYQLAKLLFTQTQQRDGSDGSEKMMEKVIAIVEAESKTGKISPEARDKVLDIIKASMLHLTI